MIHNTNNLSDMSRYEINKSYNMNKITLDEVAQVLKACKNHDNTAKFEQTIVETNKEITKIFYKVMDITEFMINNQSSDLEQIKRAMTITDNLNLVRSEYLCELDIFLNEIYLIPENYKLIDGVIQK